MPRIAIGYDADFTVVDLKKQWTVGKDWLASRCDWSPFEGDQLTGKAIGTIIRGHRVMWEDALANAAIGEPVRFEATQFNRSRSAARCEPGGRPCARRRRVAGAGRRRCRRWRRG